MNLLFLQQLNKTNYFSYLLALFPLAFIAGNMIININIIIIILSSLIFFKKKIFKTKYYFLDTLILLFFTLLIISWISVTSILVPEAPIG